MKDAFSTVGPVQRVRRIREGIPMTRKKRPNVEKESTPVQEEVTRMVTHHADEERKRAVLDESARLVHRAAIGEKIYRIIQAVRKDANGTVHKVKHTPADDAKQALD